MDVSRYISEEIPESNQLEYKDARADNRDIAEELVALANSGGGTLILGVRESDGEIMSLQNVSKFSEREEAVNSVIERRVEPNLSFQFETGEVNGHTLAVFSVENQGYIHSFQKKDTPVYPVRQGSITGHMHGYEIYDFYRDRNPPQVNESPELSEQTGTETSTESTVEMPSVDNSEAHFIPAPEGHISDVCLFSDCYYPGNPVRITTWATDLQPDTVETIFATIDDLFEFHHGHFTLNQSNAAWVGRGFTNFYQNIRDQSDRYAAVPDDYDLDEYKTEQVVFVANLEYPFPESLVIVYAEPYTTVDGYRRVTINFVLDGFPADSSALTEFSNRTELIVPNAHKESIPEDGIPNPTEIPVNTVEQLTEVHPLGGGSENWVSGLICVNPFHGRQDLLNRYLDFERLSSISNYSRCLGNLHQHHLVEDEINYEAQRFVVTDFDAFTEAMPITLRHVRFDIDWRPSD